MDNFTVSENPGYLRIYEFEKYDHVGMRSWLQEGNWKVSIYASAMYLTFIYWGQKWMENRKPFHIRQYFVLWNAFLSVLSFAVCARMLPELIVEVSNGGFFNSLCQFENHNVATSFWGVFFCFSKILDFGDTIFLVLCKKPVIFLHWYHHVSVAIYCLFVADSSDPATRWFAVINSFIHLIMYTYYCLKAMQIYIPRKFAMCITISQITQMILGIYINVSTFFFKYQGGLCDRPNINIYTALAMYASYLALFGHFFYQSYIMRKPKLKSN